MPEWGPNFMKKRYFRPDRSFDYYFYYFNQNNVLHEARDYGTFAGIFSDLNIDPAKFC